MAKVLIVSDNPFLASGFQNIANKAGYDPSNFEYRCSKGSETRMGEALGMTIKSTVISSEWERLTLGLDLVLSLHCKQLFPTEMVKAVQCVNVHPGLNPYNRGWFPQVFSILNGMPTGATIHLIDEQLDHGAIIDQKEVPNYRWDTSFDIYNRILQAELELIEANLPNLLSNSFESVKPETEGNLNLKKDFDNLCELDLEKEMPIGKTIDLLRALTHGQYKNAFFIDPQTGKKVHVSISCEVEK